MPPQITCPHCGNTISLENRKEIDYDKILCALNRSPRTFSELLTMTNLPRKTLSIRLKDLCSAGTIVKDGGYRLSASVAPDYYRNSVQRKKVNGKMYGSILRVGKNVQWVPVALVVCLFMVSLGTAFLLSPPPPSSMPPKAIFTFSPSPSLVTGQVVTFDASYSYDGDGTITSYFWEFGDGHTASGKTVSHAYLVEGAYMVTLQVVDDKGYISKSQPKYIYVSSIARTTKFTVSPNPNTIETGWEANAFVNKPLTFDSSMFNTATGFLADRLWDFGDGSAPLNGFTVSYAYQASGEYVVSLTITDVGYNTFTLTERITVYDLPATRIYISIPSGYSVGDTITVSIMISDVTDLYSWQAGMTFNPMVLECVPATVPYDQLPSGGMLTAFVEGEFLKRGGPTMWFPGEFDNNLGTIVAHGCGLQGTETGISGSGVLAMVTFKVIGEGDPNIHLNSVILMKKTNDEIPVFVET
ncbi:MAG: PKD domain-containing protein [Candidatus Bathyarchaeales archaeon]